MPNGEEVETSNPWEKFRWGDYGYQHWRGPYYEQGLGGWQPRPKAVAPPLTAYDIYQEAGGRYPVSMYPNLPSVWTTPLPEGKEWKQYSYNPQTFEPLAEPEWFMVSKEEEEWAAWQAPAFPTTKRAGGYTFVPEYNPETGDIIGWRNIGRTPEEPKEPVKPEVVREGLSGEQLRSLSLEFELWKSQVLQDPSIAGPAGWIRRYMIEQIQNPFAYEKQRQIHRAKAPDTPVERTQLPGGVSVGAYPERPSWQSVQKYDIKKATELGREEQTAWSRRGPDRPKRPTLPVAPKTLAEFVPGLVAGQTITKEPVTTPSGQQWMATPWSQREQLRGYTEWSGLRPYKDILDQMRMMLPEAPAGAFRKRWATTKQWA